MNPRTNERIPFYSLILFIVIEIFDSSKKVYLLRSRVVTSLSSSFDFVIDFSYCHRRPPSCFCHHHRVSSSRFNIVVCHCVSRSSSAIVICRRHRSSCGFEPARRPMTDKFHSTDSSSSSTIIDYRRRSTSF